MLTIRKEQMSEFERALLRASAESVLAFVREQQPEACARFGETEVRNMVAKCLRKAREHHIASYADILRYINVMYALGCDFESDPEYPWAREIMTHPRLRPEAKINRLVARTLEHLRTLEQAT
jgi:hypothetical protein